MELNKELSEIVVNFSKVADKIDGINRKLVNLLTVAIIAFCTTIISIAYFYFAYDYDYPQITQTQHTGTDGKATINLKGSDK